MNSFILRNILLPIILSYLNIEASPVNTQEHMQIKKSIECQDPERDYLERTYNNLEADFRKLEEVMLIMGRNSENIETEASDTEDLFDNTQCSTENRNMTRWNHQSACPFQLKWKERKDRFPFIIKEAQCSCQSCIGSSSKIAFKANLLSRKKFECKPVLKPSPILIRGNCGVDGYFKWESAIEHVNHACVCGMIGKMISH
jgi:hypothetical protein